MVKQSLMYMKSLCSVLTQPRASNNISNTNSSKMSHDNKHCLYHPNNALRSSILPSITLSMYNKKGVYLFSDQNNWLKFSVSGLFTLLLLPSLDYIICRYNRGNMYASDSTDIAIATLQNLLA